MSILIQWAKQLSSFNTQGSNITPAIAIDSLSCVYVAYDTTGTASGQLPSGMRDIVIFKLDRLGKTQWIRQKATFNTGLNDTLPDIKIDISDNIYVAYQTEGVASGQTHTGIGTDIVVIKMDSTTGDTIWTTQQPTFNTTGFDNNPSISIDKQGYIYIAYSTSGQASGQTQTATYDIVVSKLEPTQGSVIWITQQPTFNANILNSNVSITTDLSNNLCGCYQTLGQTSGQTNTGNNSDIVVFKLNYLNGKCLWVTQQPSFNTSGIDQFPSIITDQMNNIIVCYSTDGNVSRQTNIGGNDIVIFKLEPIYGKCLWTKQNRNANTTQDDNMPCVAVNNLGYIYVCYNTTGTSSNQQNIGQNDIVISKIEPKRGNCIWVNQLPTFNTTLNDLNPRIIVDSADEIYLTYQTSGIISTSDATKTGINDIVVMLLSPPYPSIVFTAYSGNPTSNPPTFRTTIKFTYKVKNNGSLPLYNIVINDNLGTNDLKLPNMFPGQEITITSTVYQLTSEDFAVGIVNAHATVDGTYYDTVATDYSETEIKVSQNPILAITKHTTSYDDFPFGFIIYSISVRNIGNIPFTNLEITDNLAGFISQRPSLSVDGLWIEEDIKVLITEELFKQYVDIQNVATVTGWTTLGNTKTKHSFSATNYTTLCVIKDTMILMCDGTLKPIQDIKRGDVVSTCHQVARLCDIIVDPCTQIDLMYFDINSLGKGLPNTRLGITCNHPIIFANARRPAKCFAEINGVTQVKQDGFTHLYDIQFDHDGTYIANGVEIQSCSSHSVANPLPLEMYYDKSLYTDEKVWDSYEQNLKLISKPVMPKNQHKKTQHIKRHQLYKEKLSN